MIAPAARQLVLIMMFLVVGLLLLMVALAFLWSGPSAQQVELGDVSMFELGAVRSFRIVEDQAVEVSEPPREQVAPEYGVHVVRLDRGVLRAFAWASPHLGWATRWDPGAEWNGVTGLFDDGFSRWRIEGAVIDGPAPRGLDGFQVEVTDEGTAVVDLGGRIQGVPRR